MVSIDVASATVEDRRTLEALLKGRYGDRHGSYFNWSWKRLRFISKVKKKYLSVEEDVSTTKAFQENVRDSNYQH